MNSQKKESGHKINTKGNKINVFSVAISGYSGKQHTVMVVWYV